MQDLVLAILVALSGWWFSTGLILLLVHRSSEAARSKIFVAATALMLIGLWCVPLVAAHTSVVMTLLGFALGLLLWGWLELTYLMGFVTGTHATPCPVGGSLTTRIKLGIGASLWHELWLLLLLLAVAVLSYQQPNPTTLWTFTALWIMRWSAKLNLVLGVRNYNQSWLPRHLAFLDSYIPRRKFNALFPVSVIGGVATSTALIGAANSAVMASEGVALSLTAVLVVLGTLEHLFLMFPMGDAKLWLWASPAGGQSQSESDRAIESLD